MAYIINRFNGTELTVVEDGVLDTTTSLGLVGRNYVGYGETQNENYVFLLENFSGNQPPTKALSGQLWYDASNKVIRVYNGTDWVAVGNAQAQETEPTPSQGGLWLKTTTNQLYVSNGTSWNLIGPETAEGFRTTRAVSTVVRNADGSGNRPIIKMILDDEVIAIVSNFAFTISTDDEIPGFRVLQKGLTLKTGSVVAGNLIGNSDTATKLKNSVTINSVPFDGSANININAPTPNQLVPGEYVSGARWNGSVEQTWSVDATPLNRIGKVVSRDSNGDFAANVITADLVGNLTGNVTAISGTSSFNNISFAVASGQSFSGNSATATRLINAPTINGVTFDGTESVVLPVQAETLVGEELATNVKRSSLERLGKLEYLEIEAPGLKVGDGNDLSIFIEGFTPTIRSDVTDIIKLQLYTGSTLRTESDITFIAARTAATDGGLVNPALVPDWNKSVLDSHKIMLGTPTHRWRNVYSQDLTADSLNVLQVNSIGAEVQFNDPIKASAGLIGNLSGNVIGDLIGNVTGNVFGYASLNLLKSGDTLTGDLTWISGAGNGLVWSANTDGASIKFYNSSDADPNCRLEFETRDNGNEYFSWAHSPSGGSKFEVAKLIPNVFGSSRFLVNGNVEATGTINASTFSGSGSGLTNLNASNLNIGTIPTSRLSGTYPISISGNSSSATLATTATNLTGGSVSATTGNFSGQVVFAAGSTNGIRFPNNAYGGAGDTATITLESAGGEATRMRFKMANDADDYFEFTANNNNGIKFNGYTVIHSGNISDYKPEKNGQGATGTWPISITGNAVTVSSISYSQVVNALGYVPLSTVTAANNQAGQPIYTGAGSGSGLRFPNDPYGGSGDAATITYETKGGEATRLTLRVTNDGDDTIEFFTPARDGVRSNGHIVLHAGNYNDYAPTKSGGGASGTWPINIGGNAETVSRLNSSQIINALGYTPLSSVTAANNQAGQPIYTGAGSGSGLRFPNDAYGGAFDTATITLETKGGEATRLTLRVTNDADDTIEFFTPARDGVKSNGHIVLHAGNYNDYSPTKTGGGASGTWPINITGNANTVSNLSYSQVVNALGFTPISSIPTSGSTFNSLLIDNTGNAELRFNSRGDSNQDLVISVQGENFIVYEPDDGNREWFRIDDTGASGAAYVYGQKVYDYGNIAFTYDRTQVVSYGSVVGSFQDSKNYFDVYPPAGYTMSGLVGFIPSIGYIAYAGSVNGDDSMRCVFTRYASYIRVWVQNTEQRAAPQANWLAIWRK